VRQICDHYAFTSATGRMVADATVPPVTHG
jgi:hypothetical protein